MEFIIEEYIFQNTRTILQVIVKTSKKANGVNCGLNDETKSDKSVGQQYIDDGNGSRDLQLNYTYNFQKFPRNHYI